MINRRELIIGGACLATAATAEAMRPNRRVSLLRENQKLENGIPRSFGQWEMRDSDGVLAPQSEDSLAAKLYNQTVTRMYAGPDGASIMLLIAYGNTQSDTLQLHRPEVCYPAFGFEVTASRAASLPVGAGVAVPGRDLVAIAPGREERISYWTRVGEYLPIDNGEQRRMRFRTALAGIIPDGVLVRISNIQADEAAGFAMNARFVTDLIRAVPAGYRPALITTEKARQLASAA